MSVSSDNGIVIRYGDEQSSPSRSDGRFLSCPSAVKTVVLYSTTTIQLSFSSLLPPITHAPCRCPYPRYPVSLCKLVQHLTSRCERHNNIQPKIHHRRRKNESKGAKQDEPAETLLSLVIIVPFCGFSAPWCTPCGPCGRPPGEEGAEFPCRLGGGGRC